MWGVFCLFTTALWCYVSVFCSTWKIKQKQKQTRKTPDIQMWTFIQWEGTRFCNSSLHLSVNSRQGHGLAIPGNLKLLPSTPCKFFREQPGTSARTSLPVVSHVLGHAASWRCCFWHSEEYIDKFCSKSSGHLKFKLCPQSAAIQINVPFLALASTSLGPFSGGMDIPWLEQEVIQDPIHKRCQSFQTKRILLACWRWVQSCNTPTRIRQLIFRKYLCLQ